MIKVNHNKKYKNKLRTTGIIISIVVLLIFTFFFVIFYLPILWFLLMCGIDSGILHSLNFISLILVILWMVVISRVVRCFVLGEEDEKIGVENKLNKQDKIDLSAKYGYSIEEIGEVYEYIQYAKDDNLDKNNITNRLIRAGWKKNFIENLLRN